MLVVSREDGRVFKDVLAVELSTKARHCAEEGPLIASSVEIFEEFFLFFVRVLCFSLNIHLTHMSYGVDKVSMGHQQVANALIPIKT